MNEPVHHDQLLTDILAEGRDAGLRDTLLDGTLRLVRRRRRFRQARLALPALVVVAAGLLSLWRPGFLDRAGSKPYVLVRTQPLPPTAWVETRPLSPGSIVSSGPNAELVSTVPAGAVLHVLTDDDLLALAAPNPAVLVRRGPHSVELVFAPPARRDSQ